MPRVQGLLRHDRPQIEVAIPLFGTGRDQVRHLVADTGAGTLVDVFELILDEEDCLQCGGIPIHLVRLSGAFAGEFPVYLVDVRLPQLEFDDSVPVVGVPKVPRGFDGIACFRFLSRFVYGNAGDRSLFVLETPH